MADFRLQRLNMVESQVRPSGLTDRRIAAAMLDTRREIFVPESLQSIIYGDQDVSLRAVAPEAASRALLAPRTAASMIQALDLSATDIVLIVGAGTGYEAAIVAVLSQSVVALEENPALAAAAAKALAETEASAVALVEGPLKVGYETEGPYDAILVLGAVDDIPPALLDQLKDGGRLVAVRREGQVGRLTRWQRLGGQFAYRDVCDLSAPLLPGFARKPEFSF